MNNLSPVAFEQLANFFLVFSLIYLAISIALLWAWGTILKAAFGISKWNVLWLLVPIVNLLVIFAWASKAHDKLKRQEEQKPQSYYSDRR